MKKIFSISLTLFFILFFLGIANSSYALDSLPQPFPISPIGLNLENIPLTPTLVWGPGWVTGFQYLGPGMEIWYEWIIGKPSSPSDTTYGLNKPTDTSAGSGNIESSGTAISDSGTSKMIKHANTQATISIPLTPGVPYYWAVRARRYDVVASKRVLRDVGEWSESAPFSIKTSGAIFQITSPLRDGYKDYPISQNFRWTTAQGAEVYGWELKSGNTVIQSLASISSSQCSAGECSVQPPQLNYFTTYTLKVIAGKNCVGSIDINNCVVIPPSPIQSTFTTVATSVLTPPGIVSPQSNAEVSVPFYLEWQAVQGVPKYSWEIRRQDNNELTDSGSIANATKVQITSIAKFIVGNAYYWQVKSCLIDSAGTITQCGDLSNRALFKVTTISPPTGAIPVPTNLSPTGTGVPTNSSLLWQLPPGQTLPSGGFYRVTLPNGTEVNWPTTRVDQTSEGATYFTLSSNTTYTWKVKTCKSSTECSALSTATFTTAGAAPPGGSGGDGGIQIPGGGIEIPNPLKFGSIPELIDNLVKFIFWIGIMVAPIMILIAGFFYVTSAGDPNRITTAKKIILYTVIGLAIILFSRGLVAVIGGVLGG